MHTSTRLTADDFTYWRHTNNERSPISFAEFCPDYHELDRVGVVSPSLEDGVLHAGQTLLALTTAFYDCHRTRSVEFFDYPQHFAFVSNDNIRQYPDSSDPWGAWRWLDVWPDHKWIAVAPTATSILQRIFEYQINRLLWPQNLWPTPHEEPLPDYTYRMLRTHLKAIYYYSPTSQLDGELPVVEVCGTLAADALLQESITRLPESVRCNRRCTAPRVERLRPVPVDEFIAEMQLERTSLAKRRNSNEDRHISL